MSQEAQERRERSEALGRAIQEYMDGQGFEGMLGDWLVFGATVSVDEEGDADAQYFIGFSGGTMLQHHALGLLAKAEDVLLNGDDSDDD